jgi:mono/diheme cytochrome c family protein
MLLKMNRVSFFIKAAAASLMIFSSMLSAAEPGDISRGSVDWANNCARCHNMRSANDFRDGEWAPIMTHMRLRGGLSGQQTRDILAFLQSSNNRPVVSSSVLHNISSPISLSGKAIYNKTCIACHGANGEGAINGVPKLSERLPLSSDEVHLQHIKNGLLSPGSAMAMPANGGNPNLTDEDIAAVLKYIEKEFGQ